MLTKNKLRPNGKELLKICEINESKNNLEALSINDLIELVIVSNTLPERDAFFVSREDVFDEIDELIFEKNKKIISIFSQTSNGQSSIALEYGHRFLQKNKDITPYVYWIKSDRNELLIEFKCLATRLDINVEDLQDTEELLSKIENRLKKYGRKILFIFDNCNQFDYIQSYIDFFNKQDDIFIIITTNKDFSNDKHSIENLQIEGLNQKESCEYLKKKLGNILDIDISIILEMFQLKDTELLSPIILNNIIGYINHKTGRIIKLSDVLDEINDENVLPSTRTNSNNSPQSKIIEIILSDENTNLDVLKYITLLDLDFIPVNEICFDLLKMEKNTVIRCLKLMEVLEVLKRVQKQNLIGIQINKHFQLAVKQNIEFAQSENDVLDIQSKLIDYFEKYSSDLKNKQNDEEKVIFYFQFKVLTDYVLSNQQVRNNDKIKLLNSFIKVIENDVLKEGNLYYKNLLEAYQ